MKKASFYRCKEGQLQCLLCPHYCKIGEGEGGLCRVRENREGDLYEMTYPFVPALSIDPIEKKPLYHFYPGSPILSLGMSGCNLSCSFCQNYHLSTGLTGHGIEIPPLHLVEKAEAEGSIGLAFTYSEPLIFFEYVKEAASLAYQRGLKVVLVSNGYINRRPLKELIPYLHAVNLDIKGFSDHFYREYCGGSLGPVLDTAALLVKEGVHLEVTNLIIPTLNDREGDLLDLINFLKDLKEDIPLHLSRYFPCYQMSIPKTPKKTLVDAYFLAKGRLPYVYVGNFPASDYQKTYCLHCGETLITRYPVLHIRARKGKCPTCGTLLPIKGLTST